MDCVLYDLDGTLADPYHRRGFVRVKPKNWKAFFEAQVNDTVIEPIATIARELYKEGKYKVIIFTARPDTYKEMTETWLKNITSTIMLFTCVRVTTIVTIHSLRRSCMNSYLRMVIILSLYSTIDLKYVDNEKV